MLYAIGRRIDRDRHDAAGEWNGRAHAPVQSLTRRERDVMSHVVSGSSTNRLRQLGTSEITVKVHRAHVMQKMKADFASRPGEDWRVACRPSPQRSSV